MTAMRLDDVLFDVANRTLDQAAAREALTEHGVLVLRGLFDPDWIAEANRRIDAMAAAPAIAGVPGYNKVDHPKKLFSPFICGGPLVEMSLDERVISLVEAYMDSPCVLAEANVKIDEPVGYEYFPMHADFMVGWRKGKNARFVLGEADIHEPIGLGAAIYMHETHEGAFTYCAGSHRMMAPRGTDLDTYPADERRAVMATRVRIDGMAGDMVLFDDRGFHGPDQPSRARRRVVLLDYYRVKTFGFTQVSPLPIWSNDLGRLTATQMRVAGAGADFMVSPEEYMGTRFRRNGLYGPVKFMIENAYLWPHLKQKVKAALRGGTKG
jgi:Phytanoyl-CoA dioxygenase (PhyH)